MSGFLNIPGHACSAAVEAVILIKLLPQWTPEYSSFGGLYIRLLGVHTGFILLYFFVYLGLIYPYFISPLRRFPLAKGQREWVFNLKMAGPEPFAEWITHADDEAILLLRRPFNDMFVLLADPKALAEVLVHNPYDFEKPEETRDFLRRVMGDGLIVVEGDQHKFQRKHILPAFGFRHIKALYPMMYSKALTMVDCIGAELPNSEVIEMCSWASKATLDIIGVAGLGREFDAMRGVDDELVKSYDVLFEISTEKLLYFFLISAGPAKLVEMLPWKLNKIVGDAIITLRRVCRELVLEKRELVKINPDNHFDILSVLIKSGDFGDDELIDQLLTFLAAGHETTSAAFTWLTFLLAIHPDARRRLRDEIVEFVPSDMAKDTSVDTAKVLEGLPYMNGVINESLRLYPTVPISIRNAVRDCTIMGEAIPKDTRILLPMWGINRSPKLWGSNAADFTPERWIDVNADGTMKPNNHGGADSNYHQMTFLHGPRSCIGQNFAKAELRCLVATFVRSFDWELMDEPESIRPRGIVTIKPEKGLRLKLTHLPR